MNTIKRTVDLAAGVTLDRLDRLFAQDNKDAHIFDITVMSGGEAVDLSDANIKAYMILADESTVPIEGAGHVWVDGNVVSVMLDEHCYVVTGHFSLIINASLLGSRTAIYWADGTVTRTMTDTIIDPGNVIPSLDELLDKIAEIDKATKAADEAAERAETAADNIAGAEDRALQAVTNAEEAVEKAQAWANADMSVEMLPTDSPPDVNVERDESGKMQIRLSLPRGEKGDTPDITLTVETGAAGTQASVTKGGTEDAPTFHLVIPRGDTGAVEGLEYYGDAPAALGEASAGSSDLVARGDHVHPMPTAEEIGAIGSGNGTMQVETIGQIASLAYSGSMYPLYTFDKDPEPYSYIIGRYQRSGVIPAYLAGDSDDRYIFLCSVSTSTAGFPLTINYVALKRISATSKLNWRPAFVFAIKAASDGANVVANLLTTKTTINIGPLYGIKTV